MSAPELTAKAVEAIDSGKYDMIVLNFANPDMVGHTGSLPAAIKAVEAADTGLGKIVEAIGRQGGALLVTADHGNCEQMIDPATGGPHTAHTTYDVELFIVDDRFRGKRLTEGGRLADVAPTALHMMALAKPPEMSGISLIPA
jgi:2,3-bisphosphoglycerate-independent phosphoglycerate mutase